MSVQLLSDEEIAAWMPGGTRWPGGSEHESGRDVLAGVLAQYDEAHRRYHDGRHVRRVVSGCVASFDSVELDDPATVVWAALWHDAIYDPRSSTNEEDSASLATEELCALGINKARAAEVARLILLTKGHAVDSHDLAGAVLVDADLAVLGGSPEEYGQYVRGVRFEYSFVPDDAWRVGRSRVLRNLLDLSQFFHLRSNQDREVRARQNLFEELSALGT